MTGSAPVASTTVDSSPIGVGPPSRIVATRAPRSASTCAAVVGLTWPERLALGAAIGRSADRRRAWATGCPGTRSAMVSSPAVVRSATGHSGALASTSVRAPGQNASASRRPTSVRRASRDAASMPATCTISGLKCGRPLAAKIAATARPLVASAPRPYTVSVGKATSSPARRLAPAASIASRVASMVAIGCFHSRARITRMPAVAGIARDASLPILGPIGAEQGFLAGLVLGNGGDEVGDIDEAAPVQVFRERVALPAAATHRQGER